MTDPEQLMLDLLAMWTEPDRARRQPVIEKYFHPGIQFYEPDDLLTGYDALQSFCESLQARYPGARFTLKELRTQGNSLRAYWAYGTDERPEAATGMDFAVLDGDKVSVLYAYVDPREPDA